MHAWGIARALPVTLACLLIVLVPAAHAAAASSVPVSELARIELEGLSEGVLRWYHTCPGDYNQDGLVNASDITPLGVNIELSALPDAFPVRTHYSVIDGDQNGMLTIADMTTIGAHFNLDVLGGYNVYAAHSLDEYPETNAAPSKPGAQLMANVALAATVTAADDTAEFKGRKVRARKKFRFEPLNPMEYQYWWLRPVDKDGNEGTPSTPVIDIGFSVPRNDESAALASWDAGTGILSWYYYNHGDYNCDGLVGVSDMIVLGFIMGSEVAIENSMADVLDGDGNGVIDMGDTGPIGANLNNEVAGYNVYAVAHTAAYPASNDTRSTIEPLTSVEHPRDPPFPGGPDVPYRPLLSVELPEVTPGTYLWVRPYDYAGYEGTPSNLVVAE